MKVFLAVFLLAFATYVSAECLVTESLKVKLQWASAFGHAHERVAFGLELWRDIIDDHPEIKAPFSRVRGDNIYSPEFGAHSQRVLSGLDITISMLDTPDMLAAQLAHLKVQHVERNLKPEFFDIFLKHLLHVLGDRLGTHFDFGAWHDCVDQIIDGIK
nr:globin D1 [Lumbricus terrestris]